MVCGPRPGGDFPKTLRAALGKAGAPQCYRRATDLQLDIRHRNPRHVAMRSEIVLSAAERAIRQCHRPTRIDENTLENNGGRSSFEKRTSRESYTPIPDPVAARPSGRGREGKRVGVREREACDRAYKSIRSLYRARL